MNGGRSEVSGLLILLQIGCFVAAARSQLLGLELQQLSDLVAKMGQPAYRARQLFDALHRQRVRGLEEITSLPIAFRHALGEAGYEVGIPELINRFVSRDGTVRYLVGLSDGESVETVWMPEGDGGETGDTDDPISRDYRRATICISSQVGCAVGCQFCLTAKLGVRRNLTAGEIVGQVVAVLNDKSVDVASQRINLVFMGMGEPLLNFDNFMQAVRVLVEGVGIPESRMTVSTAGIVPKIYDLGKEPIRPKLAISLNASNDEVRGEIMPINRKWDIADILEAARAFPLRPRERLTFEYVLLKDVNDQPQHARELIKLVGGMKAKINLIAWNPGPDTPFDTPGEDKVQAFQQMLVDGGIPAFIRKPRGRDIYAACGQLKRTTELVAIG